MNPESSQNLTQLKWVWINFIAWFAGLACIILLMFPYEALGIGGQSAIGLGMGAGVGFVQGRFLKRYQFSAKTWFWASFIGLSIPYLLYDIGAFLLSRYDLAINTRPEFILPFATAIGSLLAGWIQYDRVLQKITTRTWPWMLLNCLGWTLAHLSLVTLGPSPMDIRSLQLPLFLNVVISILIILAGGPIVGIVTGPFLRNVVNPQR